MRRIVAAVLITSALAMVGIATSAAPAQAAGCSGISCAGLDPVTEGCAASTPTSSSSALATLQNWFSRNCNSNWARGELTQRAFSDGDSFALSIVTTDSRGHDEIVWYPSDGTTLHISTWAWSDMVDGTNLTSAFMYVYDRNGGYIQTLQANQ